MYEQQALKEKQLERKKEEAERIRQFLDSLNDEKHESQIQTYYEKSSKKLFFKYFKTRKKWRKVRKIIISFWMKRNQSSKDDLKSTIEFIQITKLSRKMKLTQKYQIMWRN